MGAIVNAIAVLVGGGLGLLLGRRIKKNYLDTLMSALALVVVCIGVSGAVGSEDTLCLIVCVALGTLLGELLRIERGIEKLGETAERKFSKGENGGRFSSAFVSCTLLYCVGSMTVMGCLESGMSGENGILYAKSVLDFVSSVAYAAAMGPGVLLSAASVIVIEGLLTLLAGALSPFLTAAAVTEMSAVGGVLLVGLGINMLGLRSEKLRVANMLPAVFLPPFYLLLSNFLSGLF